MAGAEFIPQLRDFGSGEAEFLPRSELVLLRGAPHPFRDMTGEGALNEELSILHWILDHALRFKP